MLDSRPETPHRSLRRQLLAALFTPLLIVGCLSVTWDLTVARRLTDGAYDQALTSAAMGMAVRLETDADHDMPLHLDAAIRAMTRISAPDTWRFLLRDVHGAPLAGDRALSIVALPAVAETPAFSDARIDGEPLRVVTYLHKDDEGDVVIVVATSQHHRKLAAARLVGATVWPNLALIVVALLFVWLGVRTAMRPVDAIGSFVARRSPTDLVPIPVEAAPKELLPLLRAVNGLMTRLREAAVSQQGFLSQTAHQLRTPLASMRAQLEVLRGNLNGADHEQANRLLLIADRLAHLTHQMLALARAEPDAVVIERRPVDLASLLEQAATAADDAAKQRGVEVEFSSSQAVVDGADWMLSELLSNLIDNAMAHAPEGSTIRIACGASLEAGRNVAVLEVWDQGPGIAKADRLRAFEPFVRLNADNSAGSGLGLAIVREIARRHEAQAMLLPGEGGLGTCARVVFPMSDHAGPSAKGQTSRLHAALATPAASRMPANSLRGNRNPPVHELGLRRRPDAQ